MKKQYKKFKTNIYIYLFFVSLFIVLLLISFFKKKIDSNSINSKFKESLKLIYQGDSLSNETFSNFFLDQPKWQELVVINSYWTSNEMFQEIIQWDDYQNLKQNKNHHFSLFFLLDTEDNIIAWAYFDYEDLDFDSNHANNTFYKKSKIDYLKKTTLNKIPQLLDKEIIYKEIVSLLEDGDQIKEIVRPPFFYLPSDIDRVQIDLYPRYYKLGDLYFSLATRGNMNTPINSYSSFSGILVAKEKQDTSWQKFFEIENLNNSINNPLYLWSENKKTFMTVVDSNGAGSGEGLMKLLFSENSGKTWELEKCFYRNFYGGICEEGSRKDLNNKLCKRSELKIEAENKKSNCFNLDLKK